MCDIHSTEYTPPYTILFQYWKINVPGWRTKKLPGPYNLLKNITKQTYDSSLLTIPVLVRIYYWLIPDQHDILPGQKILQECICGIDNNSDCNPLHYTCSHRVHRASGNDRVSKRIRSIWWLYQLAQNNLTSTGPMNKTKEELKAILDASLHYIMIGSPLKAYHQQKFNQTILQFNQILAREAKWSTHS